METIVLCSSYINVFQQTNDLMMQRMQRIHSDEVAELGMIDMIACRLLDPSPQKTPQISETAGIPTDLKGGI